MKTSAPAREAWLFAVALATAVVFLPQCDDDEASSSPDARAHAPAAPSSAPSAKHASVEKMLPCRAIRVEGKISMGVTGQLAHRQALTGKEWLTLPMRASVAIKHAKSAREYKLFGAAKVLPCANGSEAVLLESGGFRAAMGFGARPGALVLVATPFGLFRYSDATLEVSVNPRRARLTVQKGSVSVVVGVGVKLIGESEVVENQKAILKQGSKYTPLAQLTACEEAARHAADLAATVVANRAPEKLGALAGEHVRARGLARERCLIASAAAGLATEPARAGFEARVAAAEKRWMALPKSPSSGQK